MTHDFCCSFGLKFPALPPGESFFCAKKVGSFSSEREKSLKYLRLKAFWRGRIPLGVLLMAKVLSPSFFLAWRKLLGGLNGCIMSG